ncbi:MAG: hypothetical protein ACRDQ7_06025, partial [Haloechinothrix sp.]
MQSSSIDSTAVVVESGVPAPGGVAIVEREGWGHPDALADHLAGALSRTYSGYPYGPICVCGRPIRCSVALAWRREQQ